MKIKMVAELFLETKMGGQRPKICQAISILLTKEAEIRKLSRRPTTSRGPTIQVELALASITEAGRPPSDSRIFGGPKPAVTTL